VKADRFWPLERQKPANGLLHIDPPRIVPEEKKPRRIAVDAKAKAA